MGLARSFIKGPRFAFHHKEKLMACEQCVFGTGKHSCGASLGAGLPYLQVSAHHMFTPGFFEPTLCTVCGKPSRDGIHS
jgi:hypothetical protein